MSSSKTLCPNDFFPLAYFRCDMSASQLLACRQAVARAPQSVHSPAYLARAPVRKIAFVLHFAKFAQFFCGPSLGLLASHVRLGLANVRCHIALSVLSQHCVVYYQTIYATTFRPRPTGQNKPRYLQCRLYKTDLRPGNNKIRSARLCHCRRNCVKHSLASIAGAFILCTG